MTMIRLDTNMGHAHEAYLVSTSKGGARCMYVVSLAKFYDGERDGFVVVEKVAKGPELAAAVALVFAL